MPQISGIRDNHSQCNRTVCGGDDFYARDDCVAMGEDGEWTEVGTMMEFRTDHACWDIEGALILFGGSYQEQSTEVFNLDSGLAESSYTLEYPSRGACVIDDLETGTAILSARHSVSRYDLEGWIEDLPPMQQNRNWHGCASYKTDSGDTVLLVAGGWDTPNYSFVSSVETLRLGEPAWSFSTPFPRAQAYIRGLSLDNRVLMVGGGNRVDGSLMSYSDIFELELETFRWRKLGDMIQPRLSHAASVIEVTETIFSATLYCQET